MSSKIETLSAMQILDSRGNPTVAVMCSSGSVHVTASVPSGASTGSHEALELRDGGKPFGGKGVTKAVANVNGPILSLLKGKEVDYRAADRAMIELDSTPNKSKLGANAILGVSMAVARLQSVIAGQELFEFFAGVSGKEPLLPVPLLNIINGGVHAGGELKMQEFLIVPAGLQSFSKAMQAASEIYHTLRSIILKRYGNAAVNLGDEGGFAPPAKNAPEAISLIEEAIGAAGYTMGREVGVAVDAAATEFHSQGKYIVDGKTLDAATLGDYYGQLIKDFKLISVEDPFYEDGFDEFAAFNSKYGSQVQIIGDDIYVTNPTRIKEGIRVRATNAVLIKLNQIGTVSETLTSVGVTHEAGMRAVVSHRSGETTDTFIADMATGLATGQIKTGAPARGERIAKYNRLLEIEQRHSLKFAGWSAFGKH
ncbi:MAG: phosphopyruvate hydratase [Methanomassiliicoccales archaeon]